ncbi:hypothetical protein M432DRAFT_372389 [Thermoascus aurantiacus ATCC 26904]
MAQPEMTYSPAYYHHEHERVVALLPHDPPLSPLPALHLPLKQQQEQPLSYAAYRSPASGASSPEATSSLSDSSTASYSIPATFVEPVPRSLEQPPAVPAAAFMLSPRAEEASISNFTSSSSGNAPKDDRSRASWSSYMSGENGPHCAPSAHNRVSVYAGIEEESDPSEKGPSALLMLLHLSTSVPIFSICAGVYTIFSLLFVVFSSPLRLCPPVPFFRSTSFATQLCQLLVPPLHVQERLVRRSRPSSRRRSPSGSPTRRKQHENDPYRSAPLALTDSYSVSALIFVHLLSPFLGLGLLLAVWTAAFFWVFAMIVGNPDGTERRDDGRAAVLGVGSWWRKWLAKARKSPS